MGNDSQSKKKYSGQKTKPKTKVFKKKGLNLAEE